MSTIVPTNDYASEWKTHQLSALQIILITGKDKLDNAYKNGFARRTWGVMSLACCVSTVCAPCVIWDSACVVLHCFGCGTNCYGCSCLCVSKGVDEVFQKNAPQYVSSNARVLLHKSDVLDVCKQFCVAFDTCIARKTVEDARKANLIRARLVEILQHTTHPDIRDDGDINALRKLVFG